MYIALHSNGNDNLCFFLNILKASSLPNNADMQILDIGGTTQFTSRGPVVQVTINYNFAVILGSGSVTIHWITA